MQFDLESFKKYRLHLIVFIIYLAISLVMFWNITTGFSTRVPNGGGDVYQSMWGLWWVPYSIFTLHQSPYYTNYLFYPIGANLVSETMSPLAGILTAPIQAFAGIASTYNFLFFLSFALGGLFMFMLSRYLVKNDYAAFIAGLIFAFSPMHIAQSYSHLQWTTMEFMPLFVLFFLMMLREKKALYSICAAISFVLLTFAGDIEQGIMMAAFAIVSILIFLVIEKKDILNKRFITNLGIFAVAVLLIGSPFFVPIVIGAGSSISSASQLSNIAHNMLYSDNLASFFLPSYYNGIFHNLSLGYLNSVYGTSYQGVSYSPDITEKVSYIGYSVLFLIAFALYHEHRKNRLRDVSYWIAIGVVFFLLAIGPNIQIGSFSTGIPTLYSLYRIIPGFKFVREPGRFDAVITIALAVLAAIGFDHLSKSKYNLGSSLALAVVFTILILIEYNGMPLSASFAKSLTTSATIPSQYSQISGIAGNLSVLELPALPNLTTGSFLYPGISMYYQTAFKKPIVGGYTTRTNSTQEQLVQNIPLAVSASYLENGEGLIYPYPITEDYSNLTLFWLASYKVGAVSVINNAYTPAELSDLQSYLYTLFGNPVYVNANVTIYSTSGIESIVGGRSMVSYISGSWVPGYAFCDYSFPCNSNFSASWWGGNVRAVSIYLPNKSSLNVSFKAYSYYSPRKLYLFLDSNSTPFSTMNLSTKISQESLNITLPRDFSQIVLYSPNSTFVSNEDPYLNFGISNLSITPR